jgi:hypothetical protein
MSTFERREDCPPVEALIWEYVARDYGGDFAGVNKLSFADLLAVRSAVDRQMSIEINKAENDEVPE